MRAGKKIWREALEKAIGRISSQNLKESRCHLCILSEKVTPIGSCQHACILGHPTIAKVSGGRNCGLHDVLPMNGLKKWEEWVREVIIPAFESISYKDKFFQRTY